MSIVTDRLNGIGGDLAVKAPVRAVSTANLTLSGLQTVGGVVLVEGDRVLVKDQTSSVDNGIYNASTGAWTRATDFDGNRDVVQGTIIPPNSGSTYLYYRVTTANPIVIGTTLLTIEPASELQDSYPQTEDEDAADATPAFYINQFIQTVKRHGAVADGDTGRATSNSSAIQKAVNSAANRGGYVEFAEAPTDSEYCTNAPIIVGTKVSLIGAGKDTTIIKKTTNTASTISDNTVTWYNTPTAIGNPIAVIHCVQGSSGNWSDAFIRDLCVEGDTSNPNTGVVDYGIFMRGMTDGRIIASCAKNVKVGFFLGAGASLASSWYGNVAHQCHRGFYIDFTTSMAYFANFANKCRYLGHDLSGYYEKAFANACDHGGHADVRLSDEEVCLAYYLRTCRGGSFEGNGAESHNGPILKLGGCTSFEVRNNIFLAISSDHDNVATGLNIYALELDSNTDLTIEKNRFSFAVLADDGVDKLRGSAVAGSHYNWRTTGALGYARFNDNRFVDGTSSVIAAGWENTSGSMREDYEEGSFTATFNGVAGTVTGTMRYTRYRDQVQLFYPDLSGTGNSTIATISSTAFPASILPSRTSVQPVIVRDNGTIGHGTVELSTAGLLTFGNGIASTAFSTQGTKSVFRNTLAYNLT